ncbi:MAG TPA: hypothetical protein VFH56_02680 [Acidimicrobiales bacterium]|nr:hypothetical protein [Acidimicrobiales bacterium]
MSVPVRNFLKARRDRALGAIMGHAERELFPKLTHVEQTAFRKVVLESLNSYHDSALDLFKSDVGTVRNDELISLLSRIEAHLDEQ